LELTEASEPDAPTGRDVLRALPRRRQIEVAAVGALLTIGCFVRFGFSERALVGSVFAATLVLLSATDLERRLIPNVVVLPATGVVLLAQIAFFPNHTVEWLLASFGAALFFFLPLLVYPSGLGMGDVKLAALMGAALGKSVTAAILGALLAGAAYAIFVLAREGMSARKSAIPYGPFLAVGGLVVLFIGGH
jgi:prepilin signal peptidase PulO-like enzyme (type II secretory pathway)